jgi:hypothetical protein
VDCAKAGWEMNRRKQSEQRKETDEETSNIELRDGASSHFIVRAKPAEAGTPYLGWRGRFKFWGPEFWRACSRFWWLQV